MAMIKSGRLCVYFVGIAHDCFIWIATKHFLEELSNSMGCCTLGKKCTNAATEGVLSQIQEGPGACSSLLQEDPT
jgi:hypothetical protein